MPQKKKQKPNRSQAAGNTASESSSGAEENQASNPQEDSAGASGPVKGSLKEFVEHFKDQHYHVIEMRILTVCSFAVFFKLFMSEALTKYDEDIITYSAMIFIVLSMLVVMASTWLDFFPGRLVELKLRPSRAQGIPMASLLLPMTCCAHLYFALHSAKPTVGLVQVYLIILCVLSACSILATVIHSIPHPTHVVFYNFVVLGMTYGLYHFLEVPIWLTLPAAAVYSLLGVWLLQNVPSTFTLGEVVIVSQGLTILLLDTAIQLVSLFEYVSLPKSLVFFRSESILFVELLVVGVVLCCVLLSPALYKLSEARQDHDRKFWSATFILMSLSVGFVLILPWLGSLLGGHHPIPFLLLNCIGSLRRIVLLLFWVLVCVLTAVLVWAQSSTAAWAEVVRFTGDSMMRRKIFHMAGVLIYLLGIILDARFTALVSSNILFLFVVVELCRVFKMWPFGETLRQFFQQFMDERDTGTVVVSNLYLLAGFCLPLWLSPLRTFNQAIRLTMYSGVLSLGIGDSLASIIGRHYGKIKWKGTKKTVEGSLAFVLSQLLTVAVLSIIDPQLGLLSVRQWMVFMVCVVITAAMEAYTWQIDNLTLPLLQHSLVITFLG